MPFLPRPTFPFSSQTPSWFAGHMARSLRELPVLLEDIHLVIEARDARLPLSSINPSFDGALNKWKERGMGKGIARDRLVVYTKRDLAEQRFEEPLRKAFMEHSKHKIMFADTRKDKDVSQVLRHAVDLARLNGPHAPIYSILVLGMPNVGKSSLLNALRRVGVHKGKAFATGAVAGVTRKLTGTVKINEDPAVYVFDTPGIMMPHLGNGKAGQEKGLRLALTAGIKEDLFEIDGLTDYLLWKMNRRLVSEPNNSPYTSALPLPKGFTPTDNIHDFLRLLAERLAMKQRGGEPDWDAVMKWYIKSWRDGKLGQWTLDELIPHRERPLLLEGEKAEEIVLEAELEQPTLVEESLEKQVSVSVADYLSKFTSPSASTNAGGDRSTSQQKKIDKAKALRQKDAKLRAKGIKVKKREDWLPGGMIGGRKRGMGARSLMGAAGRAKRGGG